MTYFKCLIFFLENIKNKVSNLFIMSLAVADLVVGVFVMPISAVYVLTGNRIPIYICVASFQWKWTWCWPILSLWSRMETDTDEIISRYQNVYVYLIGLWWFCRRVETGRADGQSEHFFECIKRQAELCIDSNSVGQHRFSRVETVQSTASMPKSFYPEYDSIW